jgi:phosphoribosylanthranilate isomerase
MAVLVKICGIRTLQEATVAVEAGSDLLGFNFWRRSPRFVEPDDAHVIIEQLSGAVRSVGVFVDEEKEQVARLATSLGLSAVQLHGDEDLEYCRDLEKILRSQRGSETEIIKAFRVCPGFDPQLIASYGLRMALLDASVPGNYGGTGSVFDWDLAVAAKHYASIILAGGIHHANVEEAIDRVEPAAVDVCSGVESAPGQKDLAKLREFLEVVRNKNAELSARTEQI